MLSATCTAMLHITCAEQADYKMQALGQDRYLIKKKKKKRELCNEHLQLALPGAAVKARGLPGGNPPLPCAPEPVLAPS